MGLSGRAVSLTRLDTSVVVEATSNSAGGFSFANLQPGRYELNWSEDPGWTSSTPNPANVAVTSSGQAFLVDLGSFPHHEISGRVFLDLAADQTDNWGTDSGLAGWTIFLDANENAQLDPDELSAATDSSGGFSFSDLPLGTFDLKLEQRLGYTHVAGGAASGYTVTVTDGTMLSGLDFPVFQYGEVRGQKFADFNGDGVKDSQEPGLPGWSIFVDSNNDGVLNAGEPSAITDESGYYVLAGVGPGDQLVREVQQFAWQATTHTAPMWDVSFAGSFNSSVGTALAISDLNDATEHVALGFAFPFVGSNYTDLWVSTNGFVWLGADGGAGCCVGSLWQLTSLSPRIAPFWTDLDPSQDGSEVTSTAASTSCSNSATPTPLALSPPLSALDCFTARPSINCSPTNSSSVLALRPLLSALRSSCGLCSIGSAAPATLWARPARCRSTSTTTRSAT